MELEEVVKSGQKDVPDKHHRVTHTDDMQRCSFLIRGTKPCKNRCSADSDVCQYHEPSRLAKERGLSVLSKRPRAEDQIAEGGDGKDDDDVNNDTKVSKNKTDMTRISGSQNRMYNPLATPLVDVGCVGLPSESNWTSLLKDADLPIHLDIGSARGKFLIDLAEMHSERNFIGIEIRNTLVEEANAILESSKSLGSGHGNCTFFCANYLSDSHRLQLGNSFSLRTINRISILFPDPWIKKKHQGRRVVQVPVLVSIAKLLCRGGQLIIVSDVKDVIDDARSKVDQCPELFTPVIARQSGGIITDADQTRIQSDDTDDTDGQLGEQQGQSQGQVFDVDEDGFVLSNPFKPLASEREQVCEMSWRKVFRLIYIRK